MLNNLIKYYFIGEDWKDTFNLLRGYLGGCVIIPLFCLWMGWIK